MKTLKTILIFAFIGISFVNAQERDQDQVRYMLIDGELIRIRDKDQSLIQNKLMIKDGTTLNADGSYITKDQIKMRLHNGECLDMDGNKYQNEFEYNKRLREEYKNLSQNQIQERSQNRSHYILIEGKVYQIMNREFMKVQERTRLANETSINPDGSFLTKNKEQFQLKNGEFLSSDGIFHKNNYQYRRMNLTQKTPKSSKNKMNKPRTIQRKGNN
jgi:hypothetical protein